MKKILAKYLGGQKYQYLWEVKLFSMFQEKDIKDFKMLFCKTIGTPKAAICLPQFPLNSSEEIIDFIKEINNTEKQACLVIAHVDYNPANLQALYILDCENGKEKECFQSVFNRWSQCSELYFVAISTDDIINYIIPVKKSSHLFSKITSVFR